MTVVKVAVETCCAAAITSLLKVIGFTPRWAASAA
jgi:hypothetical protein